MKLKPITLVRVALGWVAAVAAGSAVAQDAARGEALYRALPGNPGVGSCFSCHGEPLNNRNSVLRGGVGGPLISRTISAVGAMGYLRQHFDDRDLADISAYLAALLPAGPVASLPDLWPTGDDFGSHEVGTVAPERPIVIRNPKVREDLAIGTVISTVPAQFPVQHDCPLSLPPLGQCQVRAWFRPQAPGPATARFDVLDTSGRSLRQGSLRGQGVLVQAPALRFDGAAALIDLGRVQVGASAAAALCAARCLRADRPSGSRGTLRAAPGTRIDRRRTCRRLDRARLRRQPAAADARPGDRGRCGPNPWHRPHDRCQRDAAGRRLAGLARADGPGRARAGPAQPQLPTRPPSFLTTITVAERGRAVAPPGP
jgi:cytochrome c553